MTIQDEFEAANLLSEIEVEKLLGDWSTLTPADRVATFMKLDRKSAEELFLRVSSADQAELFEGMPVAARRSWIRFLAPDDAADMIQQLHDEERPRALELLDPQTRLEVSVLLAYHEDQAGGLMNSRYARLRPDMTVEEAIRYLRVTQSLSQLKGCLAEGFPVIFGFSVYESFESPRVAKTGEVEMPRASESFMGGHAVLAVGYDERSQRFIVRNSWGKGWGKRGYFTMPYPYLLQSSLSRDFWTIRRVEGPRRKRKASR